MSSLKMRSKQANKLDTFTKNSENRLKKYLPKGILANELRTNKMDYQLSQGRSGAPGKILLTIYPRK